MKKFLTALLALILALAMAFAMVACEETNKDPNNGNGNDTEQGGDNTGDNTGDNEEDEPLQPVDAKVFARTILEQISEAEGFSVTLNASAKGSTTVTDAEGVATPTTIDESVSDTYTLDEAMSYLSKTLTVFDDIWSLFAGIDGIDSIFTGTAQPLSDNSGYEYSFNLDTEQVKAGWQQINDYLADETNTVGSILKGILPETAPDGSDVAEDATEDDIAMAWTAAIFADGITFSGLFDVLNEIIEKTNSKEEVNKILRIVTGIAINSPISMDSLETLLAMKVEVGADGSIVGLPDENTPEANIKSLGDISVAKVVDPLLANVDLMGMKLTYTSIGTMLNTLLWYFPVATIYDLAIAMTAQSNGWTFVPVSSTLAAVEIQTATLTVTIKTDKNMRLSSFSAEAVVKGAVSVDILDDWGEPTGKTTDYAADITASASGTFGYEAVSAGTNGDAGSEALAA